MRKLSLLLFLLPLFFTAQLRLKNIYELYNLKTEKIDLYVINGLGFKKISFKDAIYSFELEFFNKKKGKDAMYIRLISPKEFDNNIVIIKSPNKSYIQNIKSDLINDGFEYLGEKEFYTDYFIYSYQKNDVLIMISKFLVNKFYEINIVKLRV